MSFNNLISPNFLMLINLLIYLSKRMFSLIRFIPFSVVALTTASCRVMEESNYVMRGISVRTTFGF